VREDVHELKDKDYFLIFDVRIGEKNFGPHFLGKESKDQ